MVLPVSRMVLAIMIIKSFYALSDTMLPINLAMHLYQGFRPGGFYANRKWEETATTNAALDFGFLNNRISGMLIFIIKKPTTF